MLTRTRKGVAAAAIAATALTGVAACGTSSGSAGGKSVKNLQPKDALRTAAANLQSGKAETITFKIDADAGRLMQIDKAGKSGGTPLTAEQAKAIAGGSVVLAVKSSGKALKDSQAPADIAATSYAFTLNAGDQDNLVQLRYVDKNLYGRADVNKFLSYSGGSRSAIDKKLAGSNPPAFVTAALDGKWLKLPFADTLAFFKNLAGPRGGLPSADPSQAAALAGAFGKIYDNDTTVTKQGSGGDGDHYVISGQTQKVITDVVTTLKTQLATIPGASKAFAGFDASKVPAKNVTVDAYVKNNTLSSVKLDVSQFASGKDKAQFGGKPLYVEAAFDNAADISAPSGATDVNIGALLGYFGGMGNSGGTGF